MNPLKRLLLRWRLGIGPEDAILADYETLVRLARRCAYDFSHASDFVAMPAYLKDLVDYSARARMWVGLFAKGNPGKDYRIRLQQDRDDAVCAVRELVALCKAQGVEVPLHIESMDCLMPF